MFFHRETAKYISEFPPPYLFNTNGTVTQYGKFTFPLWFHNTVLHPLIYVNKYILISRTSYFRHLISSKSDCDMILDFIHNMFRDMMHITYHFHLITGNV